jgi:hypothetical protein
MSPKATLPGRAERLLVVPARCLLLIAFVRQSAAFLAVPFRPVSPVTARQAAMRHSSRQKPICLEVAMKRKTLAALLAAAALVSGNSALACGRSYSYGHSYEKSRFVHAATKREPASRIAIPDKIATEPPAPIQSQSAGISDSTL